MPRRDGEMELALDVFSRYRWLHIVAGSDEIE